MRRWWRERTAREKTVLATGAALLLLIAVFLVVESVNREQQHLQAEIPRLRADRDWMLAHAEEIRGLSGTLRYGARALTPAMVEAVLGDMGLKDRVTELQPAANQTIRLRLDQIAFPDVMELLVRLSRDHGGRVSSANFRRLDDRDGIVEAGLVLTPGADG
jgi:type II secretory pathway component PulM